VTCYCLLAAFYWFYEEKTKSRPGKVPALQRSILPI